MPPRLATLLPVPPGDRLIVDWSEVESKIGTTLPHDYKEFVEVYGEGTIDHFLGVLTPQSPSKWANLVWRVCATENPMDLDSRRETHPPFEPFPLASGLIAFGQSDNGDVLYWRTVGSPEQWTVVIFPARSNEYFEFDGSMTAFLEALLEHRFKGNVFPRDFPSDRPGFQRTDIDLLEHLPPAMRYSP